MAERHPMTSRGLRRLLDAIFFCKHEDAVRVRDEDQNRYFYVCQDCGKQIPLWTRREKERVN